MPEGKRGEFACGKLARVFHRQRGGKGRWHFGLPLAPLSPSTTTSGTLDALGQGCGLFLRFGTGQGRF